MEQTKELRFTTPLRSHVPYLLTALVLAASPSLAAAPPVAVSPGESSRVARVEARCPTFHWGAVPGATAYELAVFRVDDDGSDPATVWTRTFSGSVSGWTPTLERCLERGSRYAWSIRALGEAGETDWSRPVPFEVAAPTGREELAAALEVVREHLAASEGVGSAPPESPHDQLSAPRAGSGTAPEPVPPMGVEPALTVDGPLAATTLLGDGSLVTGVDAQFLQGSGPADFAAAAHAHSAGEIASGVLADERIPDGIARDGEVAAGFLSKDGGTLSGGLTVRRQNLALPSSFLQSDDIVVESTDAVLGLYSSTSSSLGSALVFGETPATSTFGTDKWTLVRETLSGGKDLKFTYGTNPNYGQNPTMLELTNEGGLVMPGKFSVSGSGEIVGRGIARAYGVVGALGGLLRSSPNVSSAVFTESPNKYTITLDPALCAVTPVVEVSVLGDTTAPILATYRACHGSDDKLEVFVWWNPAFGWGLFARGFSFVIY